MMFSIIKTKLNPSYSGGGGGVVGGGGSGEWL
jgi:hypothetical protein